MLGMRYRWLAFQGQNREAVGAGPVGRPDTLAPPDQTAASSLEPLRNMRGNPQDRAVLDHDGRVRIPGRCRAVPHRAQDAREAAT